MTLLFRLTSFEDIEEVKYYFENILPERDSNYFFNVNKLQQIGENETIYFSFGGCLVASAIFTGDIIEDSHRNEKFIFGHKLKNIKIIDNNKKLDVEIFATNTTYLNTKVKSNAIKRLLDI